MRIRDFRILEFSTTKVLTNWELTIEEESKDFWGPFNPHFKEAQKGQFHFWVEYKDGTIYDPCFNESNYTKYMSKRGKLIRKPVYKEFNRTFKKKYGNIFGNQI